MVRDFPTKARRKIDAIRRGIVVNRPDAADPLGVLAALGGFDIAGLCGGFLRRCTENVPILMDGFISGVAALCAVRLCPAAAKAAFASHVSSKPAARLVLEELDKNRLSPPICTFRRGTGAVASLPLWDMAPPVYNGCYSFCRGRHHANTPAMLTLVISGSASGESAFAESLCLQSPCRAPTWLPCRCEDAECTARVARHRAMRAQKTV